MERENEERKPCPLYIEISPGEGPICVLHFEDCSKCKLDELAEKARTFFRLQQELGCSRVSSLDCERRVARYGGPEARKFLAEKLGIQPGRLAFVRARMGLRIRRAYQRLSPEGQAILAEFWRTFQSPDFVLRELLGIQNPSYWRKRLSLPARPPSRAKSRRAVWEFCLRELGLPVPGPRFPELPPRLMEHATSLLLKLRSFLATHAEGLKSLRRLGQSEMSEDE